jgi:hypothetical protein
MFTQCESVRRAKTRRLGIQGVNLCYSLPWMEAKVRGSMIEELYNDVPTLYNFSKLGRGVPWNIGRFTDT